MIKTETGSATPPPPKPDFTLFQNDGNFMERFKKMQEMQQKSSCKCSFFSVLAIFAGFNPQVSY
jgi:hypothetical protein